MEPKLFECLRCGHYTPFRNTERPRCGKCGCMTGLVDNNTDSPRFRPTAIRSSPYLNGLTKPKDGN